LRQLDFNRRLEISRNFVRILIEHQGFTPQNEKHRIETAERAALKLREIISKQQKDRECQEGIKRRTAATSRETCDSKLKELCMKFTECLNLQPQKKGYALESLFTELMRISGIPVEEPFKITGEQFDGAIKYDGHYYLVELKWTADKSDPKEIGHFYYKVEGKLQARGFFISMSGFTNGVLESLPRGKELRVLLLDGNHLANVLSGGYSFQELLEHAIGQASLRGEVYCAHNIHA
jgi:restriction endonuclease Mrr